MRTQMKVIAVVVALACQRSEDRYLARSVAATEVTGRWVLTETGIDGLRFSGASTHLQRDDHVISILSDGSCSYRGFADPPRSGRAGERFVDVACEWNLRPANRQTLTLHLADDARTVLRFFFDEKDGELLLWQHAGDPDLWRYIEYAKEME